jgi:hypothetical protein
MASMKVDALLIETFDRVQHLVPSVVDGLTDAQLASRPGGTANSIAWLVWHLSRAQDHHVADAAGTNQAWFADGWHSRFALDLDALDTGYGHDDASVAQVRATADLLIGYHAAVAKATTAFVKGLTPEDLDRVVDANWSPPVTLGVRLVSVASDVLQHAGQAAYARGLL